MVSYGFRLRFSLFCQPNEPTSHPSTSTMGTMELFRRRRQRGSTTPSPGSPATAFPSSASCWSKVSVERMAVSAGNFRREIVRKLKTQHRTYMNSYDIYIYIYMICYDI